MKMLDSEKIDLPNKPNQKINVKKTFAIDSDLTVLGFKDKTQWVPETDPTYVFDKNTTLAI
jgi:cobaltochelatase CobS